MTTPTTPVDAREDRARFIAANAANWLHVRQPETGRIIGYQIPSQSAPGAWYVTTPTWCSCRDSQRGHRCKHQRAAAAHVQQARRREVIAAA